MKTVTDGDSVADGVADDNGKCVLRIDMAPPKAYTMYKSLEVRIMRVTVQSLGDECVIHMPVELLAALSIKPNDILNAKVQEGQILLSKSFQHRSLAEHAAAFGGNLNLSEEIAWGEPQGNEMW